MPDERAGYFTAPRTFTGSPDWTPHAARAAHRQVIERAAVRSLLFDRQKAYA